MFADAYRDTFAAFGIRLGPEDACTPAAIEEAEGRLGVRFPDALREFYLVAGRERRINQFHNRLLPLEKLELDSKQVLFMEENQCVVFWGTPATREAVPDAAVFQGVNRREKGIEWHPESDSCFTFLNVMAVWHASFGGAGRHTAVGFVEEGATRSTLDERWNLIGKVNDLRAYKQLGRAICFLKYEDFIQKQRRLPAWRVFAVAASADELNGLKVGLPGHWEAWAE